jgi:superoxide dismutase, Cu-Zn family
MRIRDLMVAVLPAAIACGGGGGVPAPPPKESVVYNDRTVDIGRAMLTQKGDKIQVKVRVTGLRPGKHGMHLHAVATCQGPAFTTAGAHLNPSGARHGRLNPQGRHLGDLPNITVDQSGKAEETVDVAGAEAARGLKGFLGARGMSLVIHADPDDEKTDPSGSSGARVACAAFRP